MNKLPEPVMPKKACIVSLMFEITDDKQALDVKAQIDAAIKDISQKRYTFQIAEQ